MTTSISSEATMISIICLMLACWLLLNDEDNCQELNKKICNPFHGAFP